MEDFSHVLPLAPSVQGRESGKSWKVQKVPSRRTHLPDGVKTKKWEARMEKAKREDAVKKLETELKEEKQADIKRRKEITLERKRAADERQRLEEDKAKLGARKAARMRRRAGRTKKVNQ